jgi:hypothetical protein
MNNKLDKDTDQVITSSQGIQLTEHEHRLIDLLKVTLNGTSPSMELYESMTDQDWAILYQLSVDQESMAWACDAVSQLPDSVHPPKEICQMWKNAVEEYEDYYARYVHAVASLSNFYAKHGICMVQLKGLGLSTLYPVPAHRKCRDIDIYTYSADTRVLSHEAANELADRLMLEQGIEVDFSSSKHSEFLYKGIIVENHKKFIKTDSYKLAQRMDPKLYHLLQPVEIEMSCNPLAPDKQCQIRIPSPAFNQVFVPFHAAQHFGRGLTIRQLMDCAIVFRNYGIELPVEVQKESKFISTVSALAYLCSYYLGVNIQPRTNHKIIRTAHFIMQEVLHPIYPRYAPAPKHSIKFFPFKLRRFIYRGKLSDGLLGVTFVERLIRSIKWHF